MKTEDQDRKGTKRDDGLTIDRRSLMKLAAATAGVGVPLATYLGRAPWEGPAPALAADEEPRHREAYWRDGYFVHENVDASELDSGVVRARQGGEWCEYAVRQLGQDFVDWNFAARIAVLSGGMMCLDGPHSACLATHGANRGDSAFSLNAAFKGFGFYPLPTHIDAVTDELLSNWDQNIMTKAAILIGFYQDRSMWDYRMLSSLELYTTQDFETHSFLNQMANPMATICWLAIPGSFEVRAIPRLMHPRDPGLSEIDRKRMLWVNSMHDFYHGGSLPDPDHLRWISCVYHVIEVFDNSPYPGPMGTRSTPPL